jgi:hypothetical protein
VSFDIRTTLAPPGLPFLLVFRADPGEEDMILKIASAYEAASKRHIPPPAFGALPGDPREAHKRVEHSIEPLSRISALAVASMPPLGRRLGLAYRTGCHHRRGTAGASGAYR